MKEKDSKNMIRSLFSVIASMTLLSTANALSNLLSYDVRYVPTVTTDSGNGINSVSFNSPYVSLRHTATSNASSIRVNLEGIPQIPVGASLQSFAWSHNDEGDYKLPSWLSMVQSWSDSSANFVLQVNATNLLANNTDREMAIIDLVGTVAYTHGPTRYIETENRISRLIFHLNVFKDISERQTISTYFNRLADQAATNYKVFENKDSSATIPPFVIETGEIYNLTCGTTEATACTFSANDKGEPLWGDEYSKITLKSGILKVNAPLALYGTVFEVSEGASVLFSGDSSTAFSFISPTNTNTFVNNGSVTINSGILRLTGTSMSGKGTILVNKNATLEIDPDQEITFGTNTDLTKTILTNYGKVVFVSGVTRMNGAIMSLATGLVTIGMAATVQLAGTLSTGNILGGLYDGVKAVSNEDGVNAVGAIINGVLEINSNVIVIVGSGIRIQGLGSLTIKDGSTLQISIDFYDPVNYPDAGIIATGPASERILPGVVNEGLIIIDKGGMKLASGMTSSGAASMEIGEEGYLHFSAAEATYNLGGSYITNYGDISLISDAVVTFELAFQSYSSIKAYTAGSAIIFSGATNSVLTRQAGQAVGDDAANDVSHILALYTPGALLIKNGARVRLISTEPSSSDLEPARFYAATIQNAGFLEVDLNAKLETVSYAQNLQASTATEPLDTFSFPYISLVSEGAKVVVVPNGKYSISSTSGQISQAASSTLTGDKLAMEIVAGYIGGINNTEFDAELKIGDKAVAAPGAKYSSTSVNTEGQYIDEDWYKVIRSARAAGRIIAKTLTLSSGATVSLDLIQAGNAGIGYDQIDISGVTSLGGSILNVTTSFEAIAYSASSLETFSLTAKGKYSTLANGDKLYRKIPRINTLTIAEQLYKGELQPQQTTMTTLMDAKELFRIPIITSSDLTANQRFSKVSVNWVPEDESKTGSTTTLGYNKKAVLSADKAQFVDQQLYRTLHAKLQKNFKTMESTVQSDDEKTVITTTPDLNTDEISSTIHLAVEYSGGNVVLVGYEDKNASSAFSASVFGAILLGFVALCAIVF